MEDLKQENERLNRCLLEALHHEGEALRNSIKYKTCLQEIKAIAEKRSKEGLTRNYYKGLQQIIDLITNVESEGSNV